VKGSVHRRANGHWTYRFDLPPDPLTGRRRFATKSGFATRREASRALREAITAAESGRRVTHAGRTVGEFLDEWHAAIRPAIRATTWVNYRDYLDAYVIPQIGDTKLRDLSPVRLNLLYGHLLRAGRVRGRGGLAPKTVQNVHRMLRRAFRDAVRWDYLPRNPVEQAEPPRSRRPSRTVWTPEELRAYLEYVRGDRFYALWLLVATTGLRRGEIAGLRRDDIDLPTGHVSPTKPRVVVDGHAQESEPKTDTGRRRLALDPVTRDALAEYCRHWAQERLLTGHHSELLFIWPDGRPLHPDTITALFRRHVTEAGLPRIRLHDVRHSYATAALKAGVPAKIISERLGHASVAFTLQVYSHVIPGMDAQAADQIAALILGRARDHNGSTSAPISAPIAGSDDPSDESDQGKSPGQRW
jgi:integrase